MVWQKWFQNYFKGRHPLPENLSRTEQVKTRGRGITTFWLLIELRFDLNVTLFKPFRKMVQECLKVLLQAFETKCAVPLEVTHPRKSRSS